MLPEGVWVWVLDSAVANAENNLGLKRENLIVSEAYANEGVVLKRMKHGGKVKEDIVNIMNISSFKVNDKKKETVDIVFTVS